VSQALYERYKEALRRGHLAAQRGRHDAALEAYGEAADIAPDRSLPLVGIAAALRALGKTQEALTTYEAALDRSPSDELALRGRAGVLADVGRRAEAAETLDRLAAGLEATDRLPDAARTIAEAIGLAESRERRRTATALAARLAGLTDDPAAKDALDRLNGALGATPMAPGGPGIGGVEATFAEPPPPPFEPSRAVAAVEAAVESGDAELARATALDAATGHRAAGHLDAAIDACYLALATNPADPGLHLMLAELYLDRGWRGPAADKLLLLARLADMTEDGATRERLCAIAAERLPDDARLAAICG
jgi:tetratricopeptide (TPR) repeat protein